MFGFPRDLFQLQPSWKSKAKITSILVNRSFCPFSIVLIVTKIPFVLFVSQWWEVTAKRKKEKAAGQLLLRRCVCVAARKEEAEKLMKSLRQKLDEAPVAPKYIGRKIRMPGFVVPLDAVRDGRREFLLVPYFGACIHTPPPPANQIVLVSPHSKLKLSKPLESMDVVWVEGELNEARTQTQSGVSGYSLEAIQIYPYKALHQNKK